MSASSGGRCTKVASTVASSTGRMDLVYVGQNAEATADAAWNAAERVNIFVSSQ